MYRSLDLSGRFVASRLQTGRRFTNAALADTVGSTSWSERFAMAAAASVMALGLIVMLGWALGNAQLIQILPQLAPMSRNTALCFVLSGLSLLVLTLHGFRWVAIVAAGVVGIVGSITLVEIVFQVDAGIDGILGPSYLDTGPGQPGHMAPGTAIYFIVGSIALVFAPAVPTSRSAVLLGLSGSIVAAFGVASIVGFFGGVELAVLHTAVGFTLLGVGLMAFGWEVKSDPTPTPTPRWLPLTAAVGVLTGVLGLWRALTVGGYEPFALLPVIVLIVGCSVAPIFALTVYLAQRGYAQAAALATSERETGEILDSMPTLVSLLAPNGDVQLISRRTMEYTGKTLQELQAWGMSDLIHADDRASTIDSLKRGLASSEPHEIVFRMRRHDGVYRWFEALQTPLKDESGSVARWCVSVNDIDDRKRLEDSLRESARSWRSVIDGIPGLVARLDRDGGVAFVNHRIFEFTGATLEELRDWGTNGIVHPDDMPTVARIFMASIAAGTPYLIEQRLRRHDGVYRWFDNRGLPIRDESGTVTGWYVLMADIDDRQRAEDALRESDRRARLIVDSIPGLIAVFSANGELELVNHQTVEYFGRPLEEQRSWAISGELNHPEDRPRVVAAFKSAIETGEPFDIEVRGRRADGVYRWMNWYNLMVDIDDRKRAEEALAASGRNLQLIIDTIPALAWSARPDGSAEFFNQHYQDFVGCSHEELFGAGWISTVHTDDLPGLLAVWQDMMESGRGGEAEARLRRHDGEYRWFMFRTNPLRDESGTIVKWYGVNTDIEDRKRAEAELRRSHDSFAAAQQLSKTGNFTADIVVDNHVWSDELYRIFELEPGKKISVQDVRGVLLAEDLPAFDAEFQRSAAEGTDFDQVFRILTPRGTLKHLHVRARVFEIIENRPVFVGAIRDVTESRLAEEALSTTRSELAHVARITALSTLSASIAHEVSQPLSGIITNASTGLRMLAADPPNIEGARETARRTIRDGNRAAEVIARLRSLFSNKRAVSEPMDLNEAARDVIALSRAEVQRNAIELVFDPADDLPQVTGDRVQLQQVILNLLLNACDALSGIGDRPRRIIIKTEVDENQNVRLTVEDTGAGIDPDSINKLFDAFYTTKDHGMGIGLSVSRSIIEHHHGRIWASTNSDAGARFSFTLPTAATMQTAAQPSTAGAARTERDH